MITPGITLKIILRVPHEGTYEKYGPNILEFSFFQKDIWVS